MTQVCRWSGFCVLLFASAAGCASAPGRSTHEQLSRVLAHQVERWNSGDIDGFMDAYARGGELSFSSGGQTHRGWDTTLARYKQKYPDRAAMGTLSFDELETRPLGSRAALMLGRWRLSRAGGDLRGNFSLVWERAAGGWRIIHDHTSLSPN